MYISTNLPIEPLLMQSIAIYLKHDMVRLKAALSDIFFLKVAVNRRLLNGSNLQQ